MYNPKDIINNIKSIKDLGVTDEYHVKREGESISDALRREKSGWLPYQSVFLEGEGGILSLSSRAIKAHKDDPDLLTFLTYAGSGTVMSFITKFDYPVGRALRDGEELDVSLVNVCIKIEEDGPKVKRVAPVLKFEPAEEEL